VNVLVSAIGNMTTIGLTYRVADGAITYGNMLETGRRLKCAEEMISRKRIKFL
jgi:hypothetical protein